jgi:hypothetical protein
LISGIGWICFAIESKLDYWLLLGSIPRKDLLQLFSMIEEQFKKLDNITREFQSDMVPGFKHAVDKKLRHSDNPLEDKGFAGCGPLST